VLRVGEAVVLLPDADRVAAARVRLLPQPFTVAEARTALDSTRRVVVPLLELLDRQGRTQRLPDGRRLSRTPRP
jgi:selenocysteine-specific elongation factor